MPRSTWCRTLRCDDGSATNLLRALERTNWRVYGPEGAAALLGVKATTLASRMKKLGLGRR